jgi:hypothetical protein
MVGEVAAVERDLPEAEVHILDGGHFALCEKPDEIAALMSNFLDSALDAPPFGDSVSKP